MDLSRLWDPALDAHVPETRAFNEKVPGAGGPTEWTPEAIERARDLSNLMGGAFSMQPMPGFETREIAGPAGPVGLRIHVPEGEVRAVYLDIHGGGFFMGEAAMDDRANLALAEHAQVAIVSADYRLAPENPYPAGADDCEAAAVWVVEHARRELGGERLLIGGGSAGGNLAAVTLLRMRDRHDAAGEFAAANLEFGVYDVSGTPSQFLLEMTAFRDLYVGELDTLARKAPDVSPLYADLSGLPPALFTVGTADYLYDDSLFMALRWRAAGNEAELAVYPECVHGFTLFPTELGRIASARIRDFVARYAKG